MKVQAPDGRLVEAEEVDFETESEPWVVAKLKDGTTLRIRVNITKIIRTEYHDPLTGEPAYIVQSQTQMRTQVPNNLRKFEKKAQPPTGQEVG